MVKLRQSLAGDVEEECYREIGPGKRILLWYQDDTVWHEAMVGLVVDEEQAVIYTPDQDLYVERLSCLGEEGPVKLRGLKERLTLPRNLRARAYRFREKISDEVIKKVFRDSLALAREEGFNDEVPERMYNANGELVAVDDMFGGSFVRTRVRGKGGGGASPVDAAGSPKHARIVTPALADSVWVAAEPLGGLQLGQEVSLSMEQDIQCGARCAMALRQGQWVKIEMIPLSEVIDYADRRRALFADSRTSGSGEMPELVAKPKEAAGKKTDDEEDGEVRTLWVDFDEHGERFKRWRDVVKESFTPVFPETPLEGPSTALHLIKHAERHGGDPRLWLQLWTRQKHIEQTDRTYHEMKVLCDALYYGGTFDQLNIPALMAMETICRRVQAIVDAYSNPARPSWENAKLFSGQGSPEDIVSPSFRTYAAKRNKDELELLQARQKVRELRASPAVPVDEGETNDALPVKPPKTPKKKGGKGAGQGDA